MIGKAVINRSIWLSVALFVLGTLCACRSVSGDTGSLLEKRESEGRIAMVLGESALEVDPELSDRQIVLPPLQAQPDWLQAGGNTEKSSINADAAQNLRIAWSRKIGAGSDRTAAVATPPVSDGDIVIVLDANQTVHAVRLQSGVRVWSRRLKALNPSDKTGIGGGLAIAGDKVIVASGYGFITALTKRDGEIVWRRDIGTPVIGSPTLNGNLAYVTTNNNEVYAVDTETGVVAWSDHGIAETARLMASPAPAAVEDFVIVPYSSGEVVAYLANNGRRLWVDSLDRGNQFTPISSINDIPGRPVLGFGQRIYVSNQSGLTVAIDARTGARLWEQPIGSTQTPTLVGDTLYVAGLGGQIAALDAASGGVYWIRNLPRFANVKETKGRLTYLGPIIASERLLTIGSDGIMHVLDPKTGDVLRTLKLGADVYVEPIIVADKVVVYADNARLIAID